MANWINRFLALITLIVISPIFLIATIGILLSDFGPIFFLSKRAGKNNNPFWIIKFRSMRFNQTKRSRITSKEDSRIFMWGKIIRKLKIDELPQLINILKGEMAIIGPRPEDVSIVHQAYDQVMMESLLVLPGLASPGSIYNYTHLEEIIDESESEKIYLENILPLKVRLDVVYVRNRSFRYDLQLIFRTVKVIYLKAIGQKRFSEPWELKYAKNL